MSTNAENTTSAQTLAPSTIDFRALAAPFPSSQVKWLVGARTEDGQRGKVMPYIDARTVQERLDEVCGPAAWWNEYEEVYGQNDLLAVRCVLTLDLGTKQVGKEDVSYVDRAGRSDGAGARRGQEQGTERMGLAVKGAYSDALKRAAVQWGVGRYLYSVPAVWIDLGPNGQLPEGFDGSVFLPDEAIPQAELKLRQEAADKAKAKLVASRSTVAPAQEQPAREAPKQGAEERAGQEDAKGSGDSSAAQQYEASSDSTGSPAPEGAKDVKKSADPAADQEVGAVANAEMTAQQANFVTSLRAKFSQVGKTAQMRAYLETKVKEKGLPPAVYQSLVREFDALQEK